MSDDTRTAYRTCPLCEAGCGLEITVQAGKVTRIRGDRADVFSAGFLCPNGSTLKQLHDDLDAAVFEAYGWPANLPDADILTRLVALNAATYSSADWMCPGRRAAE